MMFFLISPKILTPLYNIAMIFQDENKEFALIKRDAQTHLSEPSFTQAGHLIICCK
jgi:hypothetical protein